MELRLSFRNMIIFSVFTVYIIFSIAMYYTYNSFFLNNIEQRVIEKNKIASKIANDYIKNEKTMLSKYAKQFANNRFLYLAVKKNKYLNIMLNTQISDLKVKEMSKYYYKNWVVI